MAVTLTVNTDHTASLSSRYLARQGEVGALMTVTVPAAVYALGTYAYIDFIDADGVASYLGDYDASSGTFVVSIGAADNILAKDGVVKMQFVLRDNLISESYTAVWKSQMVDAIVERSVNADTYAIPAAMPSDDPPETYEASRVSITDTGNYYSSANAEDALQEIGAGTVPVSKVKFNTSDVTAPAVGEMKWDSESGGVAIGLVGGNVTLNVGQETLIYARNVSGGAATDGQVVYIYGATGDNPSFKLANANADATASATIGIVTESIANNASGFVNTFGLVHDLNTSGFSEGETLYLGTTDGVLTSTAPSAPNYKIRVGWCVRSHPTQGMIFVSVSNMSYVNRTGGSAHPFATMPYVTTAPIIESGSGYVKYADGTMICFGTVTATLASSTALTTGGGYRTGVATFAFGQTFYDNPTVVGTNTAPNDAMAITANYYSAGNPLTTGYVQWRTVSSVGSAIERTATWIAIGRWKA